MWVIWVLNGILMIFLCCCFVFLVAGNSCNHSMTWCDHTMSDFRCTTNSTVMNMIDGCDGCRCSVSKGQVTFSWLFVLVILALWQDNSRTTHVTSYAVISAWRSYPRRTQSAVPAGTAQPKSVPMETLASVSSSRLPRAATIPAWMVHHFPQTLTMLFAITLLVGLFERMQSSTTHDGRPVLEQLNRNLWVPSLFGSLVFICYPNLQSDWVCLFVVPQNRYEYLNVKRCAKWLAPS